MIINYQSQYTKLEDLPSLKQGWIRLVHRCIYKDHVDSIRKSGLIFNREAAKLSSLQKGACYSDITSMASVYDEKTFWESMHKDDFACYDNARYADTKIIFDMPLDEFCLLEVFGRKIRGKVDNKYIVGVIPNVNGANKNLILSAEEVNVAKQKSQNNPTTSATPNDVEMIVDELVSNSKYGNKEELRSRIYERIENCKEDLKFDLDSNKNKKNASLAFIYKGHNR